MSCYLCLYVRFLDARFHGRRDGGGPEWPPAPLRVFQALVAAAAAQFRATQIPDGIHAALQWLERQNVPMIVAPTTESTNGYCLSVPNNAMDIVAKHWLDGKESNKGDANPATHRTMKTVRPTLMLDSDSVHYLWRMEDPLDDEVRVHLETLSNLATKIVALGWGIDMVVGHGAVLTDEQVEALPGERWLPQEAETDAGLRVPVTGTLAALHDRHQKFLNRLGPDGFTPPPPLAAYRTVGYRRATDPPQRPIAAFSLLRLDASGFRAFDSVRRGLTVIGMLRHAASTAAVQSGWDKADINAFILGHGETKDASGHVAVGPQRFAYLPLPSLEARGEKGSCVIGPIRRVLVTSFGDACGDKIAWARRRLSGLELISEQNQQPVALLSLIPSSDKMVYRYVRQAACWSTVTPVVLPGFDDPAHYRRRLHKGTDADEQHRLLEHLHDRIERLLRKAIVQAGFSEVLAQHADLEWRKVGFWAGVDLADRYGVPNHLRRLPRYHVRLCWRDTQGKPLSVPGPICLGGGRYFGLGLFVPEPDESRS